MIKSSIKNKLLVMVLLCATLVSIAFIIIFAILSNQYIIRTYKEKAKDLAATVASIVDGDDFLPVKAQVMSIYHQSETKVLSDEWGSDAFNAYIAQFDAVVQMPEYKRLLDELSVFKDINHVDSIYLTVIDIDDENVIYLVDASAEPCPPGCLDKVLQKNKEILTTPSVGFPPYTSNLAPYGELVTVGVPIYIDNILCGYAMVDISIADIQTESVLYLGIIIVCLVAVGFIAICIVSIYLRKRIIDPIVQLSTAASDYKYAENDEVSTVFKDISIKTGDEIEVLLDSMKVMESNINDHIQKLIAAKSDLNATKEQMLKNNEIARRDSLTGVRNRMAYEDEAKRINWDIASNQNLELAIAMIDLNFLKRINDAYGHDKGNQAIVKLCQMICKTFVHSPVFRVGGDEFVVILRGEDFCHKGQLISILKKQLTALKNNKDLQPWEQPSAAIGVAVYDSNIDKNIDNVFKRADELMYQEKRKMHAVRD